MGRSRKSSRSKRSRQKRGQIRRFDAGRRLQLETLEARQLLTLGPQLIGVQPNQGELLRDGDIRNIAPQELIFRFNEDQEIDEATLDAIQVTRAGGDGQFSQAVTRTDFNTQGAVVVQFQAVEAGPVGNDIELVFTKSDPGGARLPRVRVEGKTIHVELNTNPLYRSRVSDLLTALHQNSDARALVRAQLVSGPTSTQIATPEILYSPVRLSGANVAQISSDFGTGTNLDIVFTATQVGPEANGTRIEITRRDRGGAAGPLVQVPHDRHIRIELNSNPGNETTAEQLVAVFNTHPQARTLATAQLRVGNPNANLATAAIHGQTLMLAGADDVVIEPGYVGLGDSPHEVIFRFAERLPDDLYRVDIAGSGSRVLRNVHGFGLNDATDNQIDDGRDFSLEFELDLGPQVMAVVPQPIVRMADGSLTQRTNQIEIFFNDDELDPIRATNPAYYQLIDTGNTVSPWDDVVHRPKQVQYFPASNRVMLTFDKALDRLSPAGNVLRLRIGTNEKVPDQQHQDQMQPVLLDLRGSDTQPGSSFATAHDVGLMSDKALADGRLLPDTRIISAAIEPRVNEIAWPGSSAEPGHRSLLQYRFDRPIHSHLWSVADPNPGITTLFYNFREDYGNDPAGNPLTNLITEQQKQRAREAFEIYGRQLGVQFVESATQGFTIATGDIRAVDPSYDVAEPDTALHAILHRPLDNDLMLVLSQSTNWYEGFGEPEDVARPSWFETALGGIGKLLGIGDTQDLLPRPVVLPLPEPEPLPEVEDENGNGDEEEEELPPETERIQVERDVVYPTDRAVVLGQHLYRPEGDDIDIYRFQLDREGRFTAETVAQRREEASLLDTVLTLYRALPGGGYELLSRNDDYFGRDSFLEMDLGAGTYFVGVSSTGNADYNPIIEDSGSGGTTEGQYELRLTFRPEALQSIVDIDNRDNEAASELSQRTPLDGNGDGVPGGVFQFWFRANAPMSTVYVDKSAPSGGTGELLRPYNNIPVAMANVPAGGIVRIVGNGGSDGQLHTPEDALAYEIGFDSLGRPLADGSRLHVPQGVTVMVDRGAVFKLRRADITVGSLSPSVDRSGSALQVLGTPRLLDAGGNVIRDATGREVPGSVFFTSYNDESLGGDSNPAMPQTPSPGDWGGVMFRNDVDRANGRFDFEREGIFLNVINQADIRYGGGTVILQGVPRVIAPVDMSDARPTISFNQIRHSADAALAANPNSFEETNFHALQYQGDQPFASDYARVGPHVHNNRLVDNSINGLFVRVMTPAGDRLQEMTVSGRWDNTDVVHVVAEKLRIAGNPGGPLQTVTGPDVSSVRLQTLPTSFGELEPGRYRYRVTFVDADGRETPASDPTGSVLVRVLDEETGETPSVRLTNLPVAEQPYVGRRLYRSDKDAYVLVAKLDPGSRTYTDRGQPAEPADPEIGRLLEPSLMQLQSRLPGSLRIDPGTVVKLNKGSIETSFGGQLIAEGLEHSKIIFTSLQDPRYGAGGTFRTGGENDLQAGDWGGLYAGPVSRLSLDHTVVAYGGGLAEVSGRFTGFNAVEIHQAEARIANSVFHDHASGVGPTITPRSGRGTNSEAVIFVRGAQPVIIQNLLHDNEAAAISINVNALNNRQITDLGRSTGYVDASPVAQDNRGPLIRLNRLDNNAINGMHVRGGTVTTQGIWDDTDIAHVILDERIVVGNQFAGSGLRLESSGTESLVVKLEGFNAGFTAGGDPLDIPDRIGGVLQIVGQPGYPVVLTSLRDDSVAAGFRPDGSPLFDTNNDAVRDFSPEGMPLLPTLPDVPQGTLIDNNVPGDIPGHFQFQPRAGGSGIERVTAQGNTQLFQNASFLFDFLNYIDVGLPGQGISLGATTITQPPIWTGPDEVISRGRFMGQNGPVEWQVRSYFLNGLPTLFNEVSFSSEGALGDLRYINYLDADLLGGNDNLLYLPLDSDSPDFQVFTLDDIERIGYSQGGIYEPGPQLVNATWDGWAAGSFPNLKTDITGRMLPPAGEPDEDEPLGPQPAEFSRTGEVDITTLTPFHDPELGLVYGPGDVTTAFAWSVDPSATSATVTTYLTLVYQDPTTLDAEFSGDWDSVRLGEHSHDRNVAVVRERETGDPEQGGINDTPETSQYIGHLAPHEKAGDDVRRLGFEIHGSLNRPADVDVYSFDGVAGTEVWLDIDRTANSLDTVLELIDDTGRVLARSVNSLQEAKDPSLLTYASPLRQHQVNPLPRSPFISQDFDSTNPRDAGLRVILPGAAGTTNLYHVRVRSNTEPGDLENLRGGLTKGAYQLQIRLQELVERPGSMIYGADIRYATTGIELIGLPGRSPLTGEAAEIVDPESPTRDNNNELADAQPLGNLLNTDRGTLSVAGTLFTDDDLDWYEFEVRYDSIPGEDSQDPRHLAAVFDIDYADGMARPNTNLWVFDDLGRLVLIGGDSNTPDDRPAGPGTGISDLARGSVGVMDPYIGTVQLPASGFAPGRYYVAVSSNAVMPAEIEQLVMPAASNPLLRLEPINSVDRIAEDRIGSSSEYTTANAPAIPVLFGDRDLVTVFPPAGNQLRHGETFTITNAAGNWRTYEFTLTGEVSGLHVPVSYRYDATAAEIGEAIAWAIEESPPASDNGELLDDLEQLFEGGFDWRELETLPTPGRPLVLSSLTALPHPVTGKVELRESVVTLTLLKELTTTDPETNELVVTPLVRPLGHQRAPDVRQLPSEGTADLSVFVSRPAIQPFTLGDVTMFVSAPAGFANRTELLSVDPFTGVTESRIGAFTGRVRDIAMDPRGLGLGTEDEDNDGGIFAYTTPVLGALNDDTVGNYLQINPGGLNPAELASNLGDDGIETYQADPADRTDSVRSGANGVGVFFEAMTFNNAESNPFQRGVRGFAIGTRGDTFLDPETGEIISTAVGVPNPANILFEFSPTTGEAINPPGLGDRADGGILVAGGTQVRDRGALDTTVDAFPDAGGNTMLTGVDATIIDEDGTTWFAVEDGDIFHIDQTGDGFPDVTFEFDSGPEFYFNVDPTGPNPLTLLDGDTFIVDGVPFEFDTGSVLTVEAQTGNQLADGGRFIISDDAPSPTTAVFEFDNDGNVTSGAWGIPFTALDNQQSILTRIVNTINSVPNFTVQAVQLPGTNRITLLRESPTAGVVLDAPGIGLFGQPGVAPNAIRIPIEEIWTVEEIGRSISQVIDGTQPGGFQAGAEGNRVNFLGAQDVNFDGVVNPVFSDLNPAVSPPLPTGTPGTNNPLAFPVPFLATDNPQEIAARVHAAVVSAGFSATLSGANVILDPVAPPEIQPTFISINLGTPPLLGAIGIPDSPLRSGALAPGGLIKGMAFVGQELYTVTDTGSVFRVANAAGGSFNPDSQFNVADYVEGSQERLQAVNPVEVPLLDPVTEVPLRDPVTGEPLTEIEYQPIRFTGLTAGPQNAEGGRFANLLFGIEESGRVFAFDTYGRPQPVFANGAFFIETGVSNPGGLTFSNLDDNLWHVTLDPESRRVDGHGVRAAFDGSRGDQPLEGNASLYFGYESAAVQSHFGVGQFAPATPAYTYDFPGGAHGSLVSNPFSLTGYSAADRPTLYFSYFLETEQPSQIPVDDDDDDNGVPVVEPQDWMLDAFRVYVSGADGSWQLLATNNGTRDPDSQDYGDEFDPFVTIDPVTGEPFAEQRFTRSELFDSTGTWRQARVDLGPYAGQSNLRLRFEFNTAGGSSTGGRVLGLDLNVAGNELRALPGAELEDGQFFTLTDLIEDEDQGELRREVVAAFEFDLGPSLILPTGAAVSDGDRFRLDGRVYEFDTDGSVGVTGNIRHTAIPFTGEETAAQLSAKVLQVLRDNPPPAQVLDDRDYRIQPPRLEPDDTLETAFVSPLDGSTQTLSGIGSIGDDLDLGNRDVDLVAFPLEAGGSVRITTSTTGSPLNSFLRLFDADGNEVARDTKGLGDPTRNSTLEFTATRRGTYYVGISGSHNREYSPTVRDSGSVVGTPTQGFYTFQIAVRGAAGPQRVGNRVNLPNGREIEVLQGDHLLAAGAGGVSAEVKDSQSQPVPVYPIRVHAGMSSLHVADAIRIALAEHLGGGQAEAFPASNETVQIVHYGIGDPGPLGLSGPSDPRTAVPGSGLFGDLFGGFGLSAGPNGVVTDQTPGALGMQNNRFEGVYLDDIIIGFAARGEMVTGSVSPLPEPEEDEDEDAEPVLPSVAFVPNPAQPANEINRGAYQLEIRQATPYGVSLPDSSNGVNLLLTEGFDVNDRLARGVSLTVQDGSFYQHGQTFRLSAGGNAVVTFEFRDVHIPGPPSPANVPIVFDPAHDAATIARLVRNAINRADVQQMLGVRATSSDGRYEGAASTSSSVHLFGEISVLVGQLGHGPTGQAPVPEPNDTLDQAIDTGLEPGGREGFFARGVIGNNPGLAELGADVDLYRVELAEGELITVDINASVLNSPLDSLLRVFDSNGEPVRVVDEFGRQVPLVSDDDLAPGETWFLDNIIGFNSDSYLSFVAPADGVYYFGVSAFGNDAYDPQVAGSGRAGQTGHYAIRIDRPLNHEGVHVTTYNRQGDQNTFRDQGQVIVDATTVSYALNFGIHVEPGARSEIGAPWPGPVRNLAQLNTWGIIPGVTLSNNLLIDNGLGGILLSGEVEPPEEPLDPDEEPDDPDEPPPSDLEQAAPVPFARVINNTIAGTIRESIEMTNLVLTPLDGFTGDEDSEQTRVWVADLSTVSASTITSLTIRDASWLVESGTGRWSGFDLDAVKIGTELAESAEDLPELEGLKVFDFSSAGTVLTPGRQREPFVDLPFFGTLDGQIDDRFATLGEFDAVGEFGFPAFGFVTLGLGGSITFHFQRPLEVPEFQLPDPDDDDPDEPEDGLYLYIGGVVPVNELGETLDGGLITAHAVSPGEPSGVGIRVQGGVTPTLVNNVMSTLRTGIEVEEESGEVVVGGSLYHNNLADTEGIGLGEFALVADPESQLFVDPARYNYYPAAGSLVIDSSLNSLEDRFEMVQLRSPLGIAPAPILAPAYDLAGQLRVDDPTATPPPGMGSNVFKDRGALDRADFEGPRARLRVPLDNGPADRDPTESLVNLVDVSLDRFEIHLADGQGMLRGIGVDDVSVTRESVQIVQDGRRLVQGVDYRVTYNSTSNILRLTPLAGVWERESAYVIHLAGQPRHAITVAAGDKTQDGDRFRLTDAQGQETLFEFDSGYVMTIPQTLAIQIPAAGGGPGGVADGDTITVTTPSRTVTLELDRDGAIGSGNIRVPFTRTQTQGEIGDAIVTALKGANVQLSPINVGGGRVHLGVNGSQTMQVVSETMIALGVAEGILDGHRFRIDDGSQVVTFEFTTDPFVSTGSHPVDFSHSQTHEQIAANLAAEINSRNLGLNTRHLGDGVVQLGGDLNHQVTNVNARVTLSGQPGAQLPFGLRIPTQGGSFAGLITDGQTFVISREDGPSVTFEFDNNNRWTPGNTPIPFTAATSTWELANTLVNRIRTSDLQLFPYNLGNGVVILGADADYRLDVSNSNLRQTGQPGQPSAVRIPFEPTTRYAAEEAAKKVAEVINQQGLSGISATVEQDRVWVTGAAEAAGPGIRFVDAIRDLAGNPLQGNQDDGQTRFTIFIGLELDYGDSPAPYPTLRADNGARHKILDGFSLGPTVFPNADGQPHPQANAHPDDDGVVFDPHTPLIPGRTFNLTVDIRGVDGPEPVVPFAVLNAWIDFNRDGDWADAGERILSNVILDADMLQNGKYTFENLVVPANAVPGETFARFRLSTEPLTAPTGEASAGEVEDYRVVIQPNPWQNQSNRFDVNDDGHVSPIDALVLINYLNQHGAGVLPAVRPTNQPFLDVNGDGQVTPIDVLQLINHINSLHTQQGGGEGEAGEPLRSASSSRSHLDDVLAGDEDWFEILDEVGSAHRDLEARDAIFANLD